ncbi:hypothetical protein [Lentzea sp. CA-135723]|uniref:hypothetical protein n=1 Tax=Lentzea sp. CA-135723 TaxID=3239950 RepID=UPI003D8F872E
MSNIVDKFKDILDGDNDDDRKDKTPQPEDPPLTPQCCGMPPGHPLIGDPKLLTEGPVEHDKDCPNHPDNVSKQEVLS